MVIWCAFHCDVCVCVRMQKQTHKRDECCWIREIIFMHNILFVQLKCNCIEVMSIRINGVRHSQNRNNFSQCMLFNNFTHTILQPAYTSSYKIVCNFCPRNSNSAAGDNVLLNRNVFPVGLAFDRFHIRPECEAREPFATKHTTNDYSIMQVVWHVGREFYRRSSFYSTNIGWTLWHNCMRPTIRTTNNSCHGPVPRIKNSFHYIRTCSDNFWIARGSCGWTDWISCVAPFGFQIDAICRIDSVRSLRTDERQSAEEEKKSAHVLKRSL